MNVITVRQFLDAGEGLSLSVETGEKFLDRKITETALNRPGLALAGYFDYFAEKRIQVLGLAEWTYVKSLAEQDRAERMRALFARRFPALILTRSRHALPEMIRMADEFHIPVLRSPMITGQFMNKATLLIADLSAPRLRVHATMVDIMGIGVMIEGPPGIGKSESALTLIERGHSLVADDITVLHRSGANDIHATSVEITRFHMEIRGLGIIHVPSLFGVASMRTSAKLDLIARLERPNPQMEADRSGLTPETRDVLGVKIPLVTLPVAAGRDLAHVIEVAALNQRLKNLGHDAAKELDQKMIDVLSRKRG
jgi:HPr kinase/phosphorylase